jgi:hypothetical protein
MTHLAAEGKDHIGAPQSDVAVAEYASLTRALEQAPIKNRGHVFLLVASCAAADVDVFRQDTIDGLWEIAFGTGLVPLIGTTSIADTIARAFWSDVS